MRIQHNIMAMNAYRNYNNNTRALSKNLEKLSSGYKINRAGDDAAGLAISEKMRAQITGLKQAQSNAKSGINLVQTAEGAMQEVHDMLNRMVQLADQSANGTFDDEVDRVQLQKEVSQLKDEINRIADATNFNGIKLLDGSLEAGFDITAKGEFSVGGNLPKVGTLLGTDTVLHNDALTTGGTEFSIDLHNFTFSNKTGEVLSINIGGNTFTLDADDGMTADIEMTAADIVAAFADGKFKDAAGDAMTAGEATIGGQTFGVTDGGDGRLTFKQTNAPTSAAEEVNGAMEVTVTGAGTAAVAGTQGSVSSAITVTGTAGDGDTLTFTSTGGTTDLNLTATYSDATASWTVTGAPSGFDAAFDGTKLTLTSQTAGSAVADPNVGTITVTAGGTNAGITTTPTAATATWSAGTDDAAAGAPSGKGDYNVSTTDITNVTSGGTDRLASTYFELTKDMVADGASITIGKDTYTFTTDKSKVGTAGYVDATSGDFTTIAKNLTDAAAANGTYTVGHDGTRVTLTEVVDQANFDLTTADGIEKSLGFSGPAKSGSGLTLQIGDTSDDFNKLTVDIKDMHADSLGIADVNISTQEGAATAVKAIKDAINAVSNVRGTLGATQNRLDHTINNLSVMTENIQDAEATIRDTDVAEEMMAYTKNNILIQSAQAMLAQANQVPQGVLQLLQ